MCIGPAPTNPRLVSVRLLAPLIAGLCEKRAPFSDEEVQELIPSEILSLTFCYLSPHRLCSKADNKGIESTARNCKTVVR